MRLHTGPEPRERARITRPPLDDTAVVRVLMFYRVSQGKDMQFAKNTKRRAVVCGVVAIRDCTLYRLMHAIVFKPGIEIGIEKCIIDSGTNIEEKERETERDRDREGKNT